ncbi:phage portal protein [Zavarzinella formosa]|uniref:phage portal protein n=1 Tax=Zavarzinella formosa TaxID=360055 RepID=UPI0002FED4F3|nr:phage portal protein [Zavarzinella formosa]
MTLIGRMWRAALGRPAPKSPGKKKPGRGGNATGRPASKFDAAQTTDENRNLWKNADALGPNAGTSPDVRAVLRNRSRYEAENNAHLGGMIEGRTVDTLGTCPRLQLTIPGVSSDITRKVELLFQEWSERIDLGADLHLMDHSETTDGDILGLMTVNEKLPKTGVQLDLILVEAEQICTPDLGTDDSLKFDGVKIDQFGDLVSVDILDRHPGDLNSWMTPGGNGYKTYPAERVLWFMHRTRPAQARGLPAMKAALPLMGQLRRYGGAVLGAAELAAMWAAYMTQDSETPSFDAPKSEDDEEEDEEEFEQIPVARQMITMLPKGVKDIKAFAPAQPVPSFGDYQDILLTQAGRTIGAAQNTSTGSSAAYNYSSGRLDHLPYQRCIRWRRRRITKAVLDPLLMAWLGEASRIFGFLPAGLPDVSTWRRKWRWDAFDSIDPVKDVTAAQMRIEAGLSTYERECGEMGEDYEEVFEQQAREAKMRADLGLASGGTGVTLTTQEPDGTQTTVATGGTKKAGDGPTGATAAAVKTGDVQGTALNGLQVGSLMTICDKLTSKIYTIEGATSLIRISFPAADRDEIDTLVKAMASTPKPAVPAPEPANPEDPQGDQANAA